VDKYVANLITPSGKSVVKIIEKDTHQEAINSIKKRYPQHEVVKISRDNGTVGYLRSINNLK